MSVLTDRQKTANRILRKSLQLFNRNGVHGVSAHDISRELGISPGNLTYHFKRKNDIVHALVDQLEAELVETLKAIAELDLHMERHADTTLKVLQLFWRYRFFFNNVMYITAKDTTQLKRYNKIKKLAVDLLVDAYQQLVDAGAGRKIEQPNTTEFLMENTWYLLLSYLRLYLVETPKSKISEKGFFRLAALHFYSFMEPYYTDKVKAGLYEYLQGQLN